MKYVIKEVWCLKGVYARPVNEEYESEHKSMASVKKYITEWLAGWKENAEEAGKKLSRVKVAKDFTSASCAIKNSYTYDTFKLSVERAEQ